MTRYFGVEQAAITRANEQQGYVIMRNGEPTLVKNATTRSQATKNMHKAIELGILSEPDQWTTYTVERMTGLEYVRLTGRYLGL